MEVLISTYQAYQIQVICVLLNAICTPSFLLRTFFTITAFAFGDLHVEILLLLEDVDLSVCPLASFDV
jgi:hypothetical protein